MKFEVGNKVVWNLPAGGVASGKVVAEAGEVLPDGTVRWDGWLWEAYEFDFEWEASDVFYVVERTPVAEPGGPELMPARELRYDLSVTIREGR